LINIEYSMIPSCAVQYRRLGELV